jgi:RHS repeat-associated protein
MRENRRSGLMSGMWKRSMAVIMGHSQTKGRANSEPNFSLNHRATSRLYRLARRIAAASVLILASTGWARETQVVTPTVTPSATPAPSHGATTSGVGSVVGDCDGNDLVAVNELIIGVNIALGLRALDDCPSFDLDRNSRVTVNELIRAVNNALNPPPTPNPTVVVPGIASLLSSSPANGEGDVAITRETILRFSGSLDPVDVNSGAIFASFAGSPLAARLHLSPARNVVTVFYDSPLPPSARVRVTVMGDLLRDAMGEAVDADGDGSPGGVARIDFDTLSLTTLPGTTVCGRVFASELAQGDDGASVNVPLEGVTITVDGMEEELFAVTDQFGDFRLEPAPVGRFFVHIDGRTASENAPPGSYYPFVGKSWESVAGKEVNIGEVFLPLVVDGSLQPVSATAETEIEFPETVLQDFPELADTRLMVPPDSLFSDDGTRGGMVGIAPVAPDRLPGRLPPGLDFPLVITVQTDGATNFDRPVPVCFPNLPDPQSGEALAPGAKSALWSFNHDTGRFEVVGSMTVTADGELACSDPGSGILAPGWHGVAPGTSGSGGGIGAADGSGDNDKEKGGSDPPPGAPSSEDCDEEDGEDDPVVDPVYLFSGEFYEQIEDLRIPGRGLDFVWSRKYRSKIGPNTAQGNGWDFSYNIFIETEGADIIVCDGNSRRDRYLLSPVASRPASTSGRGSVFVGTGRTWGRKEHFRELVENDDGTFTMSFAAGGEWVFHPVDDRPEQGKIRAIRDRNGNELAFAYDAQGRLATVTDALGRDVDIAYNADGFIESVIDFVGREVRYEYYGDGDAGGSFGDLASVRSPIVDGTPNGNDFANGKLTTYTYTTSFEDERLNHNLLTVTDPRRNDPDDPTFGQGPYLRNVYAATQDPEDPLFDRVVRQAWGDPDDIVDMTYVPLPPSAANDFAYTKTIVNDRVGNVKEYFFDRGNRVVIKREYTGRADPDQPTTDSLNRPTSKLRADDPDFFETRYEWNGDSRKRRVIHPNGNIVQFLYESDLVADAPPRRGGNLRVIRRVPGPLAPLSDQTVIEERFDYGTSFGCAGCAGQFVTRRIDGRGTETRYEYDERGNRTRVVGRLPSIVEDFEYDEFGRMTARTRPDNGNGHRRRDEYEYYTEGPQRGYLSTRVSDAGASELTTRYGYDAVGNRVRTIDPRGNDILYTVNALGQIVQVDSREVLPSTDLRYRQIRFYDANDNLVRADIEDVDAEGRAAPDSPLTTTFEYEILNRPIRRTREVDRGRTVVEEYAYDANRNRTLVRFGEATSGRQPGNVEATLYDERNLVYRRTRGAGDEASTAQKDYDGNGNLRRVDKGLEGDVETLLVEYDGYDRAVRLTDAMGNVYTAGYDANGNRTSLVVEGELDDRPGDDQNIRLAEARWVYDAADRMIVRRELLFDPATQEDLDDGEAVTTHVYSPNSQELATQDDRGAETRVVYDTANRLSMLTDAAGNTVSLEYDASSNVVRRIETDRSDLGLDDETFVTIQEFDGLDRLVRRTDNAGNVDALAYDSRGNKVRHTDARGNVTDTEHDGLDRPTRTVHRLSDSGDGSGNAAGEIATETVWDDSSRITTQIDDNRNTTSYQYDGLDRPVTEVHPDGTATATTYDAHDNAVVVVDPNGTRVTTEYDLLDRAVRRQVERAADVLGTTFETLDYDGMSRLVSAVDDDSQVTRRYDSLSRVVAESIGDDETVSNIFDGVGNRLELAYPGGRTLSMTYDNLRRVKTIREGEDFIARYLYRGARRVEQRLHGNGTEVSFAHDDIRRVARTTHSAGETILDDRRYGWNEVGSKTAVANLLGTAASRTLAYDSTDRLIAVEETDAEDETRKRTYVLDGVGNRLSADGETYELDPSTPEPADRQVNQYSTTPFDERLYDSNGNLVEVRNTAGEQVMAYDYANRLVRHEDRDTGAVTEYAYDVLGRRIAKITDGAETRFLHDGLRVVEERDGAGTTVATYAYGRGLDEIVHMRRGASDFHFHADDLGNVVLATGARGEVVERYDYGDFGALTVLGPAGEQRSGTNIGNPYGFTGRRHDPETGLAYFRFRYLDPNAGRFTSRDPLGGWADDVNLGNAYSYVGNNPASRTDRLGLLFGEEVIAAVLGSVGQQAVVAAQLAAEAGSSVISSVTGGALTGGAGAGAGLTGAGVAAELGVVTVAAAAGAALGLAIDHFDVEFGIGGLILEELGLPGTAESLTDLAADIAAGGDLDFIVNEEGDYEIVENEDEGEADEKDRQQGTDPPEPPEDCSDDESRCPPRGTILSRMRDLPLLPAAKSRAKQACQNALNRFTSSLVPARCPRPRCRVTYGAGICIVTQCTAG